MLLENMGDVQLYYELTMVQKMLLWLLCSHTFDAMETMNMLVKKHTDMVHHHQINALNVGGHIYVKTAQIGGLIFLKILSKQVILVYPISYRKSACGIVSINFYKKISLQFSCTGILITFESQDLILFPGDQTSYTFFLSAEVVEIT
jgi:hypothetical protein